MRVLSQFIFLISFFTISTTSAVAGFRESDTTSNDPTQGIFTDEEYSRLLPNQIGQVYKFELKWLKEQSQITLEYQFYTDALASLFLMASNESLVIRGGLVSIQRSRDRHVLVTVKDTEIHYLSAYTADTAAPNSNFKRSFPQLDKAYRRLLSDKLGKIFTGAFRRLSRREGLQFLRNAAASGVQVLPEPQSPLPTENPEPTTLWGKWKLESIHYKNPRAEVGSAQLGTIENQLFYAQQLSLQIQDGRFTFLLNANVKRRSRSTEQISRSYRYHFDPLHKNILHLLIDPMLSTNLPSENPIDGQEQRPAQPIFSLWTQVPRVLHTQLTGFGDETHFRFIYENDGDSLILENLWPETNSEREEPNTLIFNFSRVSRAVVN